MIYANHPGILPVPFALGTVPASPDHVFLVYLAQLCHRVTSSPAVNEYTISGQDVTLGFTPDTGDELWSYTEPITTRGLILATVTGFKNGSNRVYTIAEAIPSGTEPIVMHLGLILHKTGTGVNHYARSGTTFTLDAAHPAPEANDPFFIFVAATQTAGIFHTLTLTKPAGTPPAMVQTGLTGTEAITQYVLAHYNARAFGPVFTTPAYGEVRHFPVSGQVEYPFAVSLSTDKLRVWEIGEISASTLIFDTWLAQGHPRVLFAELTLARVGASKTLRVATDGIAENDTGTWREWLPFLSSGVKITKALPDSFTGLVVSSYGSITLDNPLVPTTLLRELDTDFGVSASGYSTFGQSISLWLGGYPNAEGLPFANKYLLLTGRMNAASRTWTRVTIPLRDGSFNLKRFTDHDHLKQVDYLNIPDEVEGTTIPLHLGRVLNYSPILADPGNLLYCVGRASEVIAVYDNGYSVPFLAGSGIFGTMFPDVQHIELLAQPVGTVTCDVIGTNVFGGGFSLQLADVILDLAAAASLTPSVPLSQNFIDTYPYEVGYVVREPMAYEEIIETLLSGILGFYEVLPNGVFRLGVVESPTGQGSVLKITGWDEIVGTDWTLVERPPTYKTSLSYGNNETVMSGSVAAAVSLARKEFLKNASQKVEYQDAATLTTYPDAVSESTITTRLVYRADALALATKRIAFLKTPRQLFTAKLPLTAYKAQLGDVIELDFSQRYSMTSTQWLVIRKEAEILSGNAPSTFTCQLLK